MAIFDPSEALYFPSYFETLGSYHKRILDQEQYVACHKQQTYVWNVPEN